MNVDIEFDIKDLTVQICGIACAANAHGEHTGITANREVGADVRGHHKVTHWRWICTSLGGLVIW